MSETQCYWGIVLAGGEGLRLRPLVIIKGDDLDEPAYLIEEGRVEVSKKPDGQTVHLASRRAR
jgi:hypothetical protein